MPEPKTAPTNDQLAAKKRLDTFMLGLLAAEVQRKGLGLSVSNLNDVKELAQKAIRAVDGQL